MKKVLFSVDGIKCGSCKTKIEEIQTLDKSIQKLNVFIDEREVIVEAENSFSVMEFKKNLKSFGFDVIKLQKI